MAKLIKAIQHQLTSEQIAELKERFDINENDIVDIKDLVSDDLYSKLTQTPASEELIFDIAVQLMKAINEYVKDISDMIYLLLPIGSPAFMFAFARIANGLMVDGILFAHSERVVEEKMMEDGKVVKQSVFKHIKFLVL